MPAMVHPTLCLCDTCCSNFMPIVGVVAFWRRVEKMSLISNENSITTLWLRTFFLIRTLLCKDAIRIHILPIKATAWSSKIPLSQRLHTDYIFYYKLFNLNRILFKRNWNTPYEYNVIDFVWNVSNLNWNWYIRTATWQYLQPLLSWLSKVLHFKHAFSRLKLLSKLLKLIFFPRLGFSSSRLKLCTEWNPYIVVIERMTNCASKNSYICCSIRATW